MEQAYVVLAIVSGVFAASASCFAKLASDLTSIHPDLARILCTSPEAFYLHDPLFRYVWITGVLASNGLMWGAYTMALSKSSSTFKVTVLNTCANMMSTVRVSKLREYLECSSSASR
jgi:hypothetical protein